MEQFSRTLHRCTSRRKRVSNIGAIRECDQNEDTLSVYFDLTGTLPHRKWSETTYFRDEQYKKNLQVLLQEIAS